MTDDLSRGADRIVASKQRYRLDGSTWNHVHYLFHSPKLERIANSFSDAIKRFSGHSDVVTSIAISPDGRSVLSASGDQTIRLWDLTK